jgi:hypothetical protein
VSTMPSNLPLNQLMGLIRMLPPEVRQTLAQLLAQEQGQEAGRLGVEENIDGWDDDEDDDWDNDDDWDDEDEDEEWEEDEGLDRRKLLAAETFGYNYASYEDNLGNARFDELLPREVDILEQAEREGWDDQRLAGALEADAADVPLSRRLYRRAVEIVDAPTPAESFRRAVRFAIQDAVAEGLEDQEGIENLVAGICSRAADLGYLLDLTGEPLVLYGEELRQEVDLSPYSPLPGDQAGG